METNIPLIWQYKKKQLPEWESAWTSMKESGWAGFHQLSAATSAGIFRQLVWQYSTMLLLSGVHLLFPSFPRMIIAAKLPKATFLPSTTLKNPEQFHSLTWPTHWPSENSRAITRDMIAQDMLPLFMDYPDCKQIPDSLEEGFQPNRKNPLPRNILLLCRLLLQEVEEDASTSP